MESMATEMYLVASQNIHYHKVKSVGIQTK